MNLSLAHLLYDNPSKDSSLKDYYPFGMLIPGRNFSSENYPFAYNGMLKDDEMKGIGNSYTTAFREYDPRLGGRWLSVDPLANQFPWQSPYVGMDNNPIVFNDPFGDCVNCSEEAKTLNATAAAGSVPNGHTWTDANGTAFTYDESLGGPVPTNLMYDNASEFLGPMMTASNLPRTRASDPASEAFGNAVNDFFGGFLPGAIANDFYTAGTGNSMFSESETQGILRYAGIIPFVSELRAIKRIDDVVDAAKGVTNAGEMLGNFGIPRLYTYTNGGISVFVSPQAMKHLEELAANGAKLGPDYLKLLGQTHQKALHSAIDDVLSQGAIQFRKMYYSGGNEIMFAAPRSAGEFPAVIHFR